MPCGAVRCRAAVPEIITWFNKLDLEILEVYGMTENFGWSHSTEDGDQLIGWVGTPMTAWNAVSVKPVRSRCAAPAT